MMKDYALEISVTHILDDVGTIYARDFEAAMVMIQHPLTLAGDYDKVKEWEDMKRGLEETGFAKYAARSRNLVFWMKRVDKGKHDE